MPLDLATFTALAAACAPSVAPQTLQALVQVESGLDPLAIAVNGPDGGARRAASRTAAVAEATALIAAGRSVDLGLGQINSRNLPWLGLSVAAAFDPCRNLAASARVLQAGYRRAVSGADSQSRLRIALSYYNTGHPSRGQRNGYVARVLAAARSAASEVAAGQPSPPAARPEAPVWDVFARADRPEGAALLVFHSGDEP